MGSFAQKNGQEMIGIAAAPGQPFPGNFIYSARKIKYEHGPASFIKIIATRKTETKRVNKRQKEDAARKTSQDRRGTAKKCFPCRFHFVSA